MAQIPVLAEVKPDVDVTTLCYSANIGETASGTIFVMNQSAFDDRVSVALVPSGNVVNSNSFICYDSTLHYGHSLYLQELHLGSENSIYVNSRNGTSNFVFTGTVNI